MCGQDTTCSHHPLTDGGELDSHSQFHSLPSQLSCQAQSPPPSFSRSPACSAEVLCLCSWGQRLCLPQVGFGSLALPKVSNQEGSNLPEDLRGRGHDPHKAFYLLLGFPFSTPAPYITPLPRPLKIPQILEFCTQLLAHSH